MNASTTIDDVFLTKQFKIKPKKISLAIALAMTPIWAHAQFGPVFELSSIDGNNGVVFTGTTAGDKFGFAASTTGDFNGDGFDDLVIGSPYSDINGFDSGVISVILGQSDTTVPFTEFSITPKSVLDRLGSSVSFAGDINGDGLDDIIVGAPGAQYTAAGRSYVVFGSSIISNIDLATPNTAGYFQLNGTTSNDHSGRSVSQIGDFNGDNIDDYLIAAPNADHNGQNAGNTYVVFGHTGSFNGEMNLGLLFGTKGLKIYGENMGDLSGSSVSAAGDINGDGLQDIVIGAPYAASSGVAYVVFGSSSGVASIELSSLNGSNGFVLQGENANDLAGISVSSAGDFNGDNIDDVLIGASESDVNGIDSGSSYVVFGHTGSFSSVNLSSVNGTTGVKIHGVRSGDNSGISVGSIGDLNGDGIDDVIIGASSADPNGSNTGASYVVFGQSGGFSSAIELTFFNASFGKGFVLNGVAPNDFSGVSVNSAGDFNGDGAPDLIIGAANKNTSYVVFGVGKSIFVNGFE